MLHLGRDKLLLVYKACECAVEGEPRELLEGCTIVGKGPRSGAEYSNEDEMNFPVYYVL